MNQEVKRNDYNKFKCTADKCSFTCCKEWRIAIDESTYKKWEGKYLTKSTNEGKVSDELELCKCTKKDDWDYSVVMNKDKTCPFLNEDKLCRIVMEHGESYLSETCTTFPRQINDFKERTEYTLTSCCPEVVDLLYYTNELVSFDKDINESKSEDILLEIRSMMIKLMSEKTYTIPQRLMMIFYSLLDLKSTKKLNVEVVKQIQSTEYISSLAKAIKKMKFKAEDTIYETNELFLDVIENYRQQDLYTSYIEPIGELGETLESSYSQAVLNTKTLKFETTFMEYEDLVTNYILAELHGNLLMDEMELQDLIVAFQWIVIEYSVIKQSIFLKWMLQDGDKLEYTTVRDYIVVMSRITGYDQVDIKEYLENSFESLIWEWGYLAMVVGNGKI